MKPFVVTRQINAPQELVFETVSNAIEFSKILPHSLSVEFLTEHQTGLGARFKETRQMGKQQHVTELEVTEYDSPNRVRMLNEDPVADWDTTYTLTEKDGGTELKVVMECTPKKLIPGIFIRLFWGKVDKAMQADFDLVKADLESRS